MLTATAAFPSTRLPSKVGTSSTYLSIFPPSSVGWMGGTMSAVPPSAAASPPEFLRLVGGPTAKENPRRQQRRYFNHSRHRHHLVLVLRWKAAGARFRGCVPGGAGSIPQHDSGRHCYSNPNRRSIFSHP